MKTALIGLGMVAHTYGDAIANSRSISLKSLYARSEDGRKAFLERWPALQAIEAESVDEIADDDDIDFVMLTTPPNARLEIVERLLEARKPILMEKPVERTFEAARNIVEMCENADVPLGIMLQHRARPVAADLADLLPQLGKIMAVEIRVPWWRPQAYYDEPGRGTYARDGGGVLISQAIHTLDLALSLTGPVSSAVAMAATTGLHDMEAEDFVSAGLEFESGAVGQLFATTASYPGSGETITIHCRNGSAHLEAGQLSVSRHDGTSQTIGASASSGAGADPMAFTSDWHRFVIEDFGRSLKEKKAPLVPGRTALEVHRLIAGLEASAKAGKRVYLKDI